MLDQSFSFENFRIILDIENRKGNYIEEKKFFKGDDILKKSREISEKIVEKNKEIKAEKSRIKSLTKPIEGDYEKVNTLNGEKEFLKSEREETLENILLMVSEKADTEDYRLQMKKGEMKFGSQLYVLENTPEDFFVAKQLQRNIHKTFKVKQESRKTIISQLKLLLSDGFPKIVVRTDIKSFYESIPHNSLLSKIEENSLLSYPSKRLIKSILNQYWQFLIQDGLKNPTDERVGIPRGIGFSAFLSELYLRSFDKKVSSYPYVTYYKRYVDDIVIIITPDTRNDIKAVEFYRNEIKKLLFKSTGLVLNLNKTSVTDLRKSNHQGKVSKSYFITYLGYKFVLRYRKNGSKIERWPLEVLMSDEKLNRYKKKIELAFMDYHNNLPKFSGKENGINRLLLQRIKFLTNNFQLQSRKSNVFIGVYFSNEFLSLPCQDLKELDTKLKEEISALLIITPSHQTLKDRLERLSFEKGFIEKRIIQFKATSFQENKILKIWSNL